MNFIKEKVLKNKYFRIVIFGLIAGLVILGLRKEEPKEETEYSNSIVTNDCVVEIKGEVNKAGIYSVDSNSRVNDIIALANGLTDNADIININLAEKVTDGMVIIIPSLKKEDVSSDKVNINTATKEELMTLMGIGEAKALSIISYRTNNNGFKSIEEIKNVNGISEKLFLSIKDQITI